MVWGPLHPDREIGWVRTPPVDYLQPVTRIAMRCKKANGQWVEAVIISSLQRRTVLELMGEDPDCATDPQRAALGYVHFYDQRGGGIETEFKEDKQGLGLSRRNKKSFTGQAMLVHLATLAHNVLVWARRWLSEGQPKIAAFGLKRVIRDIFTTSGLLRWDRTGKIWAIIFNRHDRYAEVLTGGFAHMLAHERVILVLGDI